MSMLKLDSSALFAGIVATLVTIVIERFGGRTGGVLATIPTTIVPAALACTVFRVKQSSHNRCRLFLWNDGQCDFLLVGIHAPQRLGLSLFGTTILSLLVWTVIGSVGLVASSQIQSSGFDVFAYALSGLGLLIALGIRATWTSRPAQRPSFCSSVVLVVRGLLLQIAIGVAVWLSGLSYRSFLD